MADIMQLIVVIEWLVLGVLVFVRLKRWNKRFGELYDELQEDMKRWGSEDGT